MAVKYENINDLVRVIKRRGRIPEGLELTSAQKSLIRSNPNVYQELSPQLQEELIEKTNRGAFGRFFKGERPLTRMQQVPQNEYQRNIQQQIQQQMLSNLLPQFLQQLSPEYQQQQQALQNQQFMQSPLTQQMINPMGMPLFPDQEQPMQQQGVDFGGIASLLAPFMGQFAQSETGQNLKGYLESKGQGLMNLFRKG